MLRKQSRWVFGVVAICALTISASAQAQWGSYGSGGGSWGSGGGSWGSYGGGSWSGYRGLSSFGGSHGGSWGSSHSRSGLLHRIFHHHHWGSHGGSGGSYGSYGGHSRYSSGWGSSGGSTGGSSGGYVTSGYGSAGNYMGGETYYSPVIQNSPVQVVPGTPVQAPGQPAEGKKAMLKVNVPDDALVYVNGILTKSTGVERTYVSRGLMDGYQYNYEVRAEVIRDGKKIEETKVLSLKGGENYDLAFDSLKPAVVAETSLTLNVPPDAKISLGGNPTNGVGSVRTFSTTKLANAWTNYVVQVSVERDGRTLTQEKTIALNSGDTKSLNFDFDSEQVAAR